MDGVTVSKIAEMVGLHPVTIRRWAKKGHIECKRDYKGWRYFDPEVAVKEIRERLNTKKTE